MLSTKKIFISNRKAVREAFGKSDNDVLKDIEIIREWIKTQPHLPEIPMKRIFSSKLKRILFEIEVAMLNTKEIFISHQKAVREALQKSDKDVLRDIEIIREWIKTRSHLPEIPNDNMIEIFLVTNKFSIERTKEKLDMYYTIRSLIPEMYENSNPRLPQIMNVPEKMGMWVLLPRQTKELYRMYVMNITGAAEDFDAYDFFTYMFNLMEMRVQHDAALGDVFLLDYRNLTSGHLLKVTPVHLKKISAILEIHLHNSLEEVYNYVPREILPKEYGGDERSMDDLNDLCKEMLRENYGRFDKLDQMRVKEDLRPSPLKNDEVLGYHGNFKQLDVD